MKKLILVAAAFSLQGCAMYAQALIESRSFEHRLQQAEIANEKLQRAVREDIKRSGL